MLDPSGSEVNLASRPTVLTYSIIYMVVTFPFPADAVPGPWSVVYTLRPLGGGPELEIGRKGFTMAPVAVPMPGMRMARLPTIQLFSIVPH